MLKYDKIEISEGIGINKTNASKECDICHYWYSLNKKYKYEPCLCDGCDDLMQKTLNFDDVLMFLLKEVIMEFVFGT